MNDYKAHRYAEIFPGEDQFWLMKLEQDIRANGLREAIVLFEDQILDGRCRAWACQRAGVEPRYRQFGDDPADGDDPLAYVVSRNLHRRHLRQRQREVLAVKLANRLRRGRPKKNAPAGALSQAAAAKIMNVSRRNVQRRKAVADRGSPELQKAVEQDRITATDASRILNETKEVQVQAVEAVAAGEAATAYEAVVKLQSDCARTIAHNMDDGKASQASTGKKFTATTPQENLERLQHECAGVVGTNKKSRKRKAKAEKAPAIHEEKASAGRKPSDDQESLRVRPDAPSAHDQIPTGLTRVGDNVCDDRPLFKYFENFVRLSDLLVRLLGIRAEMMGDSPENTKILSTLNQSRSAFEAFKRWVRSATTEADRPDDGTLPGF